MHNLINFAVYGYSISPDDYNTEEAEENLYYNVIDDDSKEIVSFREPRGHNFAVVGIAEVLEEGIVNFTELSEPSDEKTADLIDFIVNTHDINMNNLEDPSWYIFSYNP